SESGVMLSATGISPSTGVRPRAGCGCLPPSRPWRGIWLGGRDLGRGSVPGIGCGFESLKAGDDVVVLGLSSEAVSTIRTVSAGGARLALVPLIALVALRGLRRASCLDAVELSSGDRRTTSRTVCPLVRFECHQLPPGCWLAPGNVDVPGAVIPPNHRQRLQRRARHASRS